MRTNIQQGYFFFSYFFMSTVLMIFISSCYGQTPSLTCPTPTSISPCDCVTSYYSNDISLDTKSLGISIQCRYRNLTDSKFNVILNKFLSSQVLSQAVYSISASNNRLTKVPAQISKFPSLFIVDLGYNSITDIPSNGGKSLILNSSKIRTLLIDLRSNDIKSIPSGVFNFPFASAVELYLQHNRITSISSDSFRFSSGKVVMIDISYNQISLIPSGIFNYSAATSVHISMSGNQFKAIPSGVFNFPLATKVGIALGGNMTLFPLDLFNFITPNAKVVNVDFYLTNKLTEIPCGVLSFPPNVTEVAISFMGNKIKTIPSCAFNFPSAKYVSIYLLNNSITTISPGAFNFPSATINLDFRWNQISVIPPNTFSQGRYELIQLQGNELKRFDSSVFKFPLETFGLSKYYPYLDITGNPIDCSTDPCHLAWLLQSANYSSKALKYIRGYDVCSNGSQNDPFSYYAPPFIALNSFPFAKNCP